MADALNLESMTRAELIELRSKIDKAITTAGDRDRQRALKAAEGLAREHGFTLAELVSGKGKGRGAGSRQESHAVASSSPGSSAVKYRNPDNPDQTWSGRGRRPLWFNEALATGRSAEDLRAG